MSLLKYDIKDKNKKIFEFDFKKYRDNVYKLYYKLNVAKMIDCLKKLDEDNKLLYSYRLGLIFRIFSSLQEKLNIEVIHKKVGFDELVDIELEIKDSDLHNFIDLFISLKSNLEIILNKIKFLLTNKNINVIMNYFDSKDNDFEYFIVYDSKTDKIYELNKDVDIQTENTLGLWINEDDLEIIENMEQPSFIHNHKKNLVFSENDIKTYNVLKSKLKVKFNFMIYSKEDKMLFDYESKQFLSKE